MKATVKEGADGFVERTLDRSKLWEIQTPQVIRPQLLRDGFAKVRAPPTTGQAPARAGAA